MHTPPAMIGAAVLSALIALTAGVLLAAAVRRRAAPHRPAYAVLAVGGAFAAMTVLVGAAVAVTASEHWAHEQQHRSTWATLVALGTATGGLLFCFGLLRLPGVTGSVPSAARLALDGVIVGAALWFVGWVLFSEPTRLLGDATPTACPSILLASVSAALSAGLSAIMVLRAPAPRRCLAVLGTGITAASVGGLGVAAGLCQAGPGLALTGAVILAVGLLVAAVAAYRIDPPGHLAIDVIRRDGEYAFVPMGAMAASAMYHLLQDGRFDGLAIAAGSVEGFALVARQYLTLHDVRAYARRLADREAHFRQLAHTDALTGLANRRGLLRALHRCAEERVPCVLLGLDLDGFKNVNDMRGHDVGDAVLAEVGRRLRGNLRPGDLAARLGGDEFAVLMHGGPAGAGVVAERLLRVLGGAYEQPEAPVFLSVSIGLAGWADEPDVELLLRHADLALRYAKQRGKNRIERYDGAYDRLLRRRTTLEHELRGAIERDELRLVFQPVASLPSVRPVGAEALLRWRHPELGNVRPDEFIPLAEESGMIARLGAWVLHQACYQLSRWLAEGHDVWVSVNVSPRELHAPEYVVQVAEALRAHHVPPQRLVLEVTEHAVATDLDELIRRLTALRLTGVRIALDDFGAGYSSLNQLRRLPIDILKIDHGLVAEHEPVQPEGRDGPAFAPMVDIVMRLGHQFGLEVIAEGVTTPTELAAVVAAGCRFGQGALFGWGVPAEHLEAMLDAATSPGARPARPAVAGTTVPRPVGPPVQRRGEGVTGQVTPGPIGAPNGDAPRSVNQNVGSVDSSHEMRQS
ncbi:bifunctional diguanylate cyclase/phosphodiesterase [Verrucosispora sp. WMMC514]|uniref:putative bifunctional diguanylate cyclase/phosphodiesterase n=1 Tax=Verrucosispora sp. WMMC514 TaxID=3015156 RepID=UPI00248B0B5E|nr:bifunctional diguanylate cyclase/phosphodiesterase [Verrucosispora sp. WMMC514]WBB89033.1 bifunctional diguanylate cyclase/phosphodiesterase [Verrucosispora sp. WMMC514]